MTALSLIGRVDAYRTLRAQAEASILPLATSLDGRRFSFQARIEGLELALGGYVMLEGGGGATLGQVRTLAVAEAELGDVGLAGEDEADVRTRLTIRLARGRRDPRPRRRAVPRPPGRAATEEEVAGLAGGGRAARASLAVGSLSLAGGAPMALDAGGFDRHTFLCGQSGLGQELRARPACSSSCCSRRTCGS